MSGHTRLARRGAVYYFRAAVPVDIKSTYGKTEETFSLKTRDYKEALKKVRTESVRIDKKFEDHRKKLALENQPPLLSLTPEQIEQIADIYLAHLLEEDEETREEGFYEDSPLHHRIKRLGVATDDRGFEPLTQAVLVESLVKFISVDPLKDRRLLLDGKKLCPVAGNDLLKCPFRNLFIDEKDTEIYRILFNYFKAVSIRWPEAWVDLRPKGNLLPKSNSFKALMKFLKDVVYIDLVGQENIGEIPTIEDFLSKLRTVDIDDKDFTTRNFEPGSGGQSKFYKLLTGALSKEQLFNES